MRTKIAFVTSLALLGALLPGTASAQDPGAPASPPPGTAGEPPPAPGGSSALAPPPPDAPGMAPDAAPAPPAPEAGPKPVPGWIRIDSDAGGVQLWGGGTFPFNDSVGLAFDMYVFQGSSSFGEFDIGPAITAGPMIITPMLGLQVDWGARHAQALVPQLYIVGGPGPIYAELWFQYYLNTVFNEDIAATATDPGVKISNQIYGRLIVDYKLTDYVAVGPELDLAHDSEADPGVVSLAVGANVLLSNVGAASSFMGFLGYETKDIYDDNHLTGRLTFVHNF